MFAKCQFSISIICPSLISKFSTERKSFPFSHIHSFIHSFLSVWTHGFLLYWVVYNLLLFCCSHSPKWDKLPTGTLSSWALCPFDTSLWFFFLIFIYLAILGLSCGMWDLVPWPDMEPGPPALEAWSLSHWTPEKFQHMPVILWELLTFLHKVLQVYLVFPLPQTYSLPFF